MKRFLSLVTALLFTVAPLAGCAEESTIGVIGGADGPTQVVVSTPNDDGQSLPEDSLALPPDDSNGSGDTGDRSDFGDGTEPGDTSNPSDTSEPGDTSGTPDDSRAISSDTGSPGNGDTPPADTASLPFDLSEYEAITGVETLILGDSVLDEEGWYATKEEVALYLMQYNQLPGNYITKKEAREMGWEGGSLDDYAPGYSIGGDRFGNYEGSLPEGHTYTECDIDTQNQKSRGAKRIVFSNDGLIFYTEDHYSTFTLLTGDE